MKVEEVPQDEKFFTNTHVRDICYALDENGNYKQVVSVGWEAKNEALSLALENINEEAEDIRKEVIQGEKSPIAYHMKVCLLNTSMLASYAGIPKRKVKKHLEMEGFKKLDNLYLQKYAEAMNMSVEELVKV